MSGVEATLYSWGLAASAVFGLLWLAIVVTMLAAAAMRLIRRAARAARRWYLRRKWTREALRQAEAAIGGPCTCRRPRRQVGSVSHGRVGR